MATLIGNGGHARDIAATLSPIWKMVPHHRDFNWHDDEYIIGVNDPQLRERIYNDIDDNHDMKWIHPEAFVSDSCDIDLGTHINYGVKMTRSVVGWHCTISPGVTICGGVWIGNCTLIGAGAVICDRVTIGNDVTIGAGTIVLPESVIEDGATYVGNPARRIR